MSQTREILVESASRLFSAQCSRNLVDEAERGIWPRALWDAMEVAGLTMAATSEERGGPGADQADMLALLRVGGGFSIPVPLAETLLAEEMLAAAGLPVMAGPLTVGPVLRRDRLTLVQRRGQWQLSGKLHRVPWGRDARAIVLLAESDSGPRTVAIERPPVEAEGWSYAHEPRDTLRFDDHPVPDIAVGPRGAGLKRDELLFRGALFRAVAMAGALERVLELTVNYAKERVQFGRPIGKFQAVQQQVAALASHVAASNAVAQAAIDAAAAGPAPFEIAAAKARIGDAVRVSTAIAHQVHGAMGFACEYPLRRSTCRLWAWRDEFGTEAEWASWIGRVAAQVGGERLWFFLSASPKSIPGVPGAG